MSVGADTAGTPFRPRLRGGHVQTLYGFWSRRSLRWKHAIEDLRVVSDASRDPPVVILCRASWQPGDRAAAPALILLHGMGGSDESSYMMSLGAFAFDAGYHVVRMNMRGAGDSYRRSPWLYNAGVEGDLVAVCSEVARTCPRIGVFGASLGANHVLLAMGRSRAALPRAVGAAVALSPPLDLLECSNALHGAQNRFYVHYFIERLKESYASVQALNPAYAPGREIGVRTVREFDEKITAPYGGFASADDYYRRSSAGPHAASIERPTLILAANDDPMIPAESVTRHRLPDSGVVVREMHPTGGHVGFTARSAAPGGFWAADRALAFFDCHLR